MGRTSNGLDEDNVKVNAWNVVLYIQYLRLILLGTFSGSALFKHLFNCLDNRCFDFLCDKKDAFPLPQSVG